MAEMSLRKHYAAWTHSLGWSYNMSDRETGIKRYDVCVNANSNMPVSINQIESFLNRQECLEEEKS